MAFSDIEIAKSSSGVPYEFQRGQWPTVVRSGSKSHVLASQDRGFVISEGQLSPRGLRPPIEAPTLEAVDGGVCVGTFHVCIAWFDRRKGSLSNPSCLAQVENDEGETVTYLTFGADDPKSINIQRNQTPLDSTCDEWAVYIMESNDGQWRLFRSLSIDDAAYVNFNLTSSELATLELAFPSGEDGSGLEDNAYPPACDAAAIYKDRLVTTGQQDILLDSSHRGPVHVCNLWTAPNPFIASERVKRGLMVLTPDMSDESNPRRLGQFNGSEASRLLKLDDSGEQSYVCLFHVSEDAAWLAEEYVAPSAWGNQVALTTQGGVYWADNGDGTHRFYVASEFTQSSRASGYYWADLVDANGICVGLSTTRATITGAGDEGGGAYYVDVRLDLDDGTPVYAADATEWATCKLVNVAPKEGALEGRNWVFFSRRDTGGPLDDGTNDEAVPATHFEVVPQLGTEMPVVVATYHELLVVMSAATMVEGAGADGTGQPAMRWGDAHGHGCLSRRSLVQAPEDRGVVRTQDLIWASDAGLLRYSAGGVSNETERLGLTELWERLREDAEDSVGIWDRVHGVYILANLMLRPRRPVHVTHFGVPEPNCALVWDVVADQMILWRHFPATAFLELQSSRGRFRLFAGDDLGYLGMAQDETAVTRDVDGPKIRGFMLYSDLLARAEILEDDADDFIERSLGAYLAIRDADDEVTVRRVIEVDSISGDAITDEYEPEDFVGEAAWASFVALYDDESAATSAFESKTFSTARLEGGRLLGRGVEVPDPVVEAWGGAIYMEWMSGLLGADEFELKNLLDLRLRLAGLAPAGDQEIEVEFLAARNERDVEAVVERGDTTRVSVTTTKSMADGGRILLPGLISPAFLLKVSAIALERFELQGLDARAESLGEEL